MSVALRLTFNPTSELRKVVAAVNGQRYGSAAEPKLSRTLVAVISGMAMDCRSGKEIADVVGADRLWRKSWARGSPRSTFPAWWACHRLGWTRAGGRASREQGWKVDGS